MIELAGSSLNERQKELYVKICDAVKNKTNFDDIKSQPEKSDVDKLYKIGIASKYKNVDYIIEMLKSGDTLFISKVFKCIWIYGNEYSHIINPEYLHKNIFPLMSLKMTKKFLIRISMYMRDTRAINFYTYCNRMKHANIAMKFLVFTPEAFKLEILKDKNITYKLRESDKLLKLFLGNSYDLAEAYYNKASECDQANILYQLRHFYYISNVKYLEILSTSTCHWSHIKRMGLRISKDIMIKHKDEIYKKPMMYLYLLNKDILVQYSTVEDAKFYVRNLISHEYPRPVDFWNKKFCDTYDYILDKIPFDQRMQFIKNIFTEQYHQHIKDFEMTKKFYNAKLYKFMSPEDREKWALQHVQSNLKLLGNGRDFFWYRFIYFDKAFATVKKYIEEAVNTDLRTEIISVLVESAKTEKDLETLFDYYCKKHVNEQLPNRKCFVDAVLSKHNVYDFSESCWNAFNKILSSLEVYDTSDRFNSNSFCKNIALIYNIIHGKEVSEELKKFIDLGINMYEFKTQTNKLTEQNVVIVFQYLLQFYLEKFKLFDYKAYNDEVKYGVRKYIHIILDLMYNYEKSKGELPEIVHKYIQFDLDEFRDHLLLREFQSKLIQQRLIRYLKNNKELVISNLPLIKNKVTNRNSFKLNKFLKIIRIYYSNDLANLFLKMFNDILVEENPSPSAIKRSVYGIFQLADMDFKTEFMAKHVPEKDKMDHSKIERKILRIQKSICNTVCYSRPSVPLSETMKYIKGDYVQFCLPMFNSYLAELPKTLCIEFIKSLLDRPSVQKHGLRMAYECFSVEDLRKVFLEVWSNTTNVPLRTEIYTYIHNKMKDVDGHEQNELFEDLKTITRSVNQGDDYEVFKFLSSDCLPQPFIGEYIVIAWNVIDRLPKTSLFIEYRKKVIDCIQHNVHLIKKDAVESIIYEHINFMLKQEQIKRKYEDSREKYLVQSKWNLLHTYVTFFIDEDDFHKKAELVMDVVKETIKIWDKVDNNEYIIKHFFLYFLFDLNHISYDHDYNNYIKTNTIFEHMLKELQRNLPPEEISELYWVINISIITRNVLVDGKKMPEHIGNSCVTIIKCLNTFTKEFSRLFIESIENRQYFVSLFDMIQDKLDMHVRKILKCLHYTDDNVELRINNIFVLVCLEILEHNRIETYMFAAKLLPCDIHHCISREDYLKVIYKLRTCEFTEVKFFMYRKFVEFDYTFRDFMLP